MTRPPLARLAGLALGLAVVLAILAIQLPPGRSALAALAVLLAILGVITTVAALRDASRGTSSNELRFRRDGVLGRAIVVAARPTGRRRGEREEIETRLDVQLPSRRRFEVTRRDWLTPAERVRVVVGRPVVVAADPAEPGHVVLVLDLPDVDRAAISALGPVAGGPGGPARSEALRDDGRGVVRPIEGGPGPDP